MVKFAGNTRAALLGVLFAVVGFSFALATTGTTGGASSKALAGTSLTFTTPLVDVARVNVFAEQDGTLDHDLGDITATGSFVRFVNAKGGFVPYTFANGTMKTKTGVTTSVLTDVIKTAQLISSNTYGVVSGPVDLANMRQGLSQFGIKLTDASGSNFTEQFRLTTVPYQSFGFAMPTTCPNGQRFIPYNYFIDTINASTSVTMKVASGALPDGLTLSANGSLTGIPTKSGTFTFTVSAVDGQGNSAEQRDTTVTTGETYKLTIADNVTGINTSLLTTALTIKTGTAGKESLTYSGLVHYNEVSVFSSLTLTIGKYTTPVIPLSGGKGQTTDKKIKVTLSKKGVLKITISKASFNGVFSNLDTTKPLIVSLALGATSKADTGSRTISDAISLAGAKATSAKGVSYKSANDTPYGAFFVTSVAGKDDKLATGDTWKAAFIMLPATGVTVSGASAAVIDIGNNNKLAEFIPAIDSSKGVKLAKGTKLAKGAAGVSKLTIAAKGGKGSLQTSLIPADGANGSGILAASKGSGSQNFNFQVILAKDAAGTSPIFGGASSSPLTAKNKSWSY